VTFSPVVKPVTVRTVLATAVSRDWPIQQLNVKNWEVGAGATGCNTLATLGLTVVTPGSPLGL
jgi:hypothetical protein